MTARRVRRWGVACTVLAWLALLSFAVGTASAQKIQLSNPEGIPFPNRLVFNRIGTTESTALSRVHDHGTVRIRNKGTATLLVSQLTLGGPHAGSWVIEAAPPLPFAIAPGSSADVILRFTATSKQRVHSGKLSISSSDPGKPTKVVQLRGYWQESSDDVDEPSLADLLKIFGYATTLANDGEDFFTDGRRVATGEEVVFPYWSLADETLPAVVQHIAAFHTPSEGHRISWHYTGSPTTSTILSHDANDAQRLLPRAAGAGSLAKGSFAPSTSIAGGTFGFVVQDQWSDPNQNDISNDDCSAGPASCGQHVRFWPARKRNGALMPDTYLMAVQVDGAVYGYQDNLYLVSNITPFVLERPHVTGTSPSDGAAGVSRNAFVAADVRLPNVGQGIDASTVTSSNVKLYPTGAPLEAVPANPNTTGGGDAIVLQPVELLAANTPYTFEVTDGVKDLAGAAFIPATISFTTGPDPSGPPSSAVQFEKVALAGTHGKFTSLTIGPDAKLYAAQQNGLIRRWTINPDGTLSNGEVLDALQFAEGGNRLLIGLVFDPAATAGNLIAWVSHTTYGFSGMPEWGSKITRLSGPNLATVQDYLVDLPRSIRDHVTNSLVFGPDGALYVSQGSNSSMGAADKTWGNRPERKLTAAVLRVDVAALNALASLPLNVRTDGGPYDPYAPGAPVKVFASGVRNAFDLVWHSNGFLYVPTNGSAANGTAPASLSGTMRLDGQPYSGPFVPAIDSVETQSDYLFRVPPPSGGTWDHTYFGHPNPARGEYALNGANPTVLVDVAQVDRYPVGVLPDVAWMGSAFNFGRNISPNGVIEYRSGAFEGAFQGKLFIARYSGGDDIIVLTPDPFTGVIPADGDMVGIPGLTQFADPLDLTENVANGDLYVSEYGGEGKITLVRPITAQPPSDASIAARAPAGAEEAHAATSMAGSSLNGAAMLDPRYDPTRFEILGNYPNPFNATTSIEYALPRAAHVVIDVFDVVGRRVDVLVDQTQEPGVHRVSFDAGRLPSGVYVYRVQAESLVRTSRMILSK